MNDISIYNIDDRWIESLRGRKNKVDQNFPYAWLVEKELTASGTLEDVGIIFLTNRECPFRCLMCDLWKNTIDETAAPGSITRQIEWALGNMPAVKHIKLYNSGSFFDERAIPLKEYESIAFILRDFDNVIVESHPRFLDEKCISFKKLLKPSLEVAIGLETVHPELLRKLNKKMKPDDFSRAVRFLASNGIFSRAFVLLRPPFLTEEEGVEWAGRSIEFAFNAGVGCCTVIPVRAGNGAMDKLKSDGLFTPPVLQSLEKVVEYGIGLNAGRVFADLWDLQLFTDCPECLEKRRARLEKMNFTQIIQEPVDCTCG